MKFREIELTRGYIAIVDADDFERLIKHKWHVITPDNKRAYACRGVWDPEQKKMVGHIYMHREITGAKENDLVDHINHDTLDNRKENLRLTDDFGNAQNITLQSNNTSGCTGVNWDQKTKKWMARITIDCKGKFLGYFDRKEDAIREREKAELEHYGEFSPKFKPAEKLRPDMKTSIYAKCKPAKCVRKSNTSGHEGIGWHKASKRWQVRCGKKHVGYFKTKPEAIKARQEYLDKQKENKH